MTIRSFVFAGAVAVATAPAFAHVGPRVWIGSAAGRLVTYSSNNDQAPTSYAPKRVFVGGVDEDTLIANGQLNEFPVEGTGVFASEFPGYQVRLDGNSGLSTGRSFGFTLPGPLLVFDPVDHAYRTTQVQYGGNAPQMSESAGANQAITSTFPVAGFDFLSYNSSGDHAHLVTALYGDGSNPVDGPHAVYAVPMQLTTSGFENSQTYYVLFGRAVALETAVFQEALAIGNAIFPAHPGDANIDGSVDTIDFNILATNFSGTHKTWAQAEFNFDGVVDTTDFNLLASNFGSSLGPAPASLGALVPEPAMAIGLLVCVPALRRDVWRRMLCCRCSR